MSGLARGCQFRQCKHQRRNSSKMDPAPFLSGSCTAQRGRPSGSAMDRAINIPDRHISRFFSEGDVDEAVVLQERGYQRLQPVSHSATTSFYFCASRDGHFGPAEISISPTASGHARNSFYKPILRYFLCCDKAPVDIFKAQYQAVYDVRIRPAQWTFGDEAYGTPPSLASASS